MVNNKINLSDYANLNYFPKLLMKLKFLNFVIINTYLLMCLMQLLKIHYPLYLDFPRRRNVVQIMSKIIKYESYFQNHNVLLLNF